MSRARPYKKWTPGVADDVWKIAICARDASQIDDVLSFLSYVLTDEGADTKAGIAIVREMTGGEIVDGLVKYQEARILSIKNALKVRPADA